MFDPEPSPEPADSPPTINPSEPPPIVKLDPEWIDRGAPWTECEPAKAPRRFYRVRTLDD